MNSANPAKKLGILLVAGVSLLYACKKDNSSSNNANAASSDSVALSLSANSATTDYAYDDVFSSAIEAGSDNNIAYMISLAKGGHYQTNSAGENSKQSLGNLGCASFTVTPLDDSTFPKTVVVNFGAGCTGEDGNVRAGTITYVFTGKLLVPGTTVSATFTNYSFNGYQLQGSYSFTNNSTLSGFAFGTQVINGKIIYPDNSWFSFSGDKHVVQTAGQSTLLDLTDDVYSITGSNVFAASNGNTLVDSITTALVKANACPYISSGIISFKYNTVSGTLDYGSGACDSVATISVGSLSKVISLR